MVYLCEVFFNIPNYKKQNMKTTYCVSCKRDTENNNAKVFKTKNESLMLKSTCSVCGHKKPGLYVRMNDLEYYDP